MRVGVGAAVWLAASERPPGDALVERHLDVEESLRPRTREDAWPKAMPLPVSFEDGKAINHHQSGDAIGSDLEVAVGVVLRLQRACCIDEIPRKAAVIQRCHPSKRKRCELDR